MARRPEGCDSRVLHQPGLPPAILVASVAEVLDAAAGIARHFRRGWMTERGVGDVAVVPTPLPTAGIPTAIPSAAVPAGVPAGLRLAVMMVIPAVMLLRLCRRGGKHDGGGGCRDGDECEQLHGHRPSIGEPPSPLKRRLGPFVP